MSKSGLIATVLALILAGQGGAQASRATELRLQRERVDSLTAHWMRAKARLDAFDDSVARSRTALDTVAVGHLRVLVAPDMRQRVEPGITAASAQVDSLLGSAATMLEGHVMVVRQYRNKTDTVAIAAVMKPGHAFPNGREVDLLWGPVNDTLVRAGLRLGAIRLVSSGMSAAFGEWLHGEINPDTVSTFAWTQARLDLVSSPSTVGRQCYNGDLQACRLMLGLVPVRDRATELFDAAGRRRFLELRLHRQSDTPLGNALENACLEGNDAACVEELRRLNWARIGAFPQTGVLTASLTQTALRLGGREALERLVRTSAPPGQALADAAGVPLDSVLGVWRRSIREARLPSQDISLPIAATSLLWVAVCGALSLRSSRWR